MDIFLIIIVVVMVIIIFVVSFYMLALYCHSQQRQFGSSISSKIIIVLGLALSWSQLLLIPLDVSNTLSNGGIDISLLYQIVYVVIFVYVTTIAPFTIFFYQSDEQQALASRLAWSSVYVLILDALCYFLVFVSNIWLSVYNFSQNSTLYSGKISIPLYMMICMSLVGSLLLSLFGGIGLFALPYDLINSYVNKPKLLKPQEARKKKKDIQEMSSKLIQKGQIIKQQQLKVRNTQGWWQKRKQTNKVNQMFQLYKKNVIQLQQEYQIFSNELQIAKVNPIVYFLKLLLGSFCLILSLIWILQLLLDVIIRPNKVPLYGFLNNLFSVLVQKHITFLATSFFALFTFYLLFCVTKGNISFGLRIPFITTFHPMKLNQTYLNSFIFNINLMLLSSIAISELSVEAFDVYLTNCYIAKQYFYISHLPMFGWIYDKRIFAILMFLIFLIYSLYQIIVHCCRKKQTKKEIQL